MSNTSSAIVCSASADGTAKIWELTQEHIKVLYTRSDLPGKSIFTLPCAISFIGHSRGINDLAWNTSGDYIATASDDQTARLWDVETSIPLVEFQGHSNFVFSTFSKRSFACTHRMIVIRHVLESSDLRKPLNIFDVIISPIKKFLN